MKNIITIVASMLFALASFAQSQEKYDFMIVTPDSDYNLHLITKEGDQEIKPTTKPKDLTVFMLAKIDDLQNAGWEVYNTNIWGESRYLQIFYLRKKKQ